MSIRRGQAALNRICDVTKQQIIALAQSKYADCDPTFMAEKLKKLDNIELSKESLRKILMGVGLWKERKNKQVKIHHL